MLRVENRESRARVGQASSLSFPLVCPAAPKGRHNPAQGNALGSSQPDHEKPCKGDTRTPSELVSPFQGFTVLLHSIPQGVALGFLVLALSGLTLNCLAEDISVVGTVDQNRISFGDSLVFTIEVKGAQGGIQPAIPTIDGLRFDGPSHRQSTMIVNGRVNQSVQLQYAVTPSRMGEFTIPAIAVDVNGKKYKTLPVQVSVVKSAMDEQLKDSLFARIQFDSPFVYVGQTVPVDVQLFVREGVPLQAIGGFQCTTESLGYRFLKEMRKDALVTNGVRFTVLTIQGSLSPAQLGKLVFGPCAVQAQLQVQRRGTRNGAVQDDPFLSSFFGNVEVRQVPVAVDPIPFEVHSLPEQGRPADFAGAVGQWKLEVSAKPTEVVVGDPITIIAKVSGDGNIDTVPTPKLGELDDFKAYDPTVKTTRNELGTQGQRDFQQVLIPKHPSVTQLPEIKFSYFDPVAKQYKVARQAPIKLAVKPGTAGTAVVGGTVDLKPRSREKLGQDIVYLKGDLGPVASVVPFCATPTFWTMNLLPLLALLGSVIWKRRSEKLRGDVAYARRSRAARNARKLLAEATSYDQIQHALQSYLGDRLNIPISGITASIVDEQLTPRGLNGELISQLKECFEECDTARFAGGSNSGNVTATRTKVERVIDEVEKNKL